MIKRFVVLILLVLIIAFGAFWAHNFFTYNFHIVIPGKVYRSAILPQAELQAVLEKYHIKTIFNLTGTKSSDWSKNEAVSARKLDIKLINIHYPAHGVISKMKLRLMVEILQAAKRPLLIHCRQGADRSGLASAISIILTGKYVTDDWRDQVSWQYNLLSPSSVGYEMMHIYSLWLKKNKLSDNKQNFLDWVNSKGPIIGKSGWFFT